MSKDKPEAAAPAPPDIANMSFEDSLNELETIVGDLEQGGVGLEDSIRTYERGTHLKRHCEEKLASARAQVEKIVQSGDGEPTLEPMDDE